MEVTYLGGSSFSVRDERTVAINPGKGPNGADVELYSKRLQRKGLIVSGPGEYEIRGVLVLTVAAARGARVGLAHGIQVGALNVVHLDVIPEEIATSDLSHLGQVDVLVVNADDLKAAETAVRELTPRVVLPYGGRAAELCAELGVKDAKPLARWSWNGTASTPKAVLLKAPPATRRAA
jgi:hypothetical protein